MIKKAFILTISIIASISLLVHSAIPHHHHDEKLCIPTQDLSIEHSHADHHHDACEHEHSEAEESDTHCHILNLYHISKTQKLSIKTNELFSLYFVSADIINTNQEESNRSIDQVWYDSGPPLYTLELISSQGLRAPPLV